MYVLQKEGKEKREKLCWGKKCNPAFPIRKWPFFPVRRLSPAKPQLGRQTVQTHAAAAHIWRIPAARPFDSTHYFNVRQFTAPVPFQTGPTISRALFHSTLNCSGVRTILRLHLAEATFGGH